MKVWFIQCYSDVQEVFTSKEKADVYMEGIPPDMRNDYTIYELDSDPEPIRFIQKFRCIVNPNRTTELDPVFVKLEDAPKEGAEVYFEIAITGISLLSSTHARTLGMAALAKWRQENKGSIFYSREELENTKLDRPLDVYKDMKEKL